MGEEKAANLASTLKGWAKAVVTSIVGLVSGVLFMYVTAVFNNVVKPAKPLANFAAHVNGLTVEFNNRSTGGVQGWWDFGDGSALEPFDPKADIFKHTYARPATYNVKLTLQNLIGEESDRTVPVTPDADGAAAPEIARLELESFTGDRVPAVYQLKCEAKNAAYCILSYGDDRPLVIKDAAAVEHLLTYKKAGSYRIRLAAVNGKQLVEQTRDIHISDNPSASTSSGWELTAKVIASYDVVKVERIVRDLPIHCAWQGDLAASTSAVRKERPADPGYTIVSAELVPGGDKTAPPARNVKLDIAPDKSKITLTCELVKPTGSQPAGARPPHWLAHTKVAMERRSNVQTINRDDVVMAVSLNSPMRIPIPPVAPGMEILRKQVSLELWDGNRKVWSGNQAVTRAQMLLANQPCFVTAIPQDRSFVLRVESAAPGPMPVFVPPAPTAASEPQRVGPYIRPVSFERNPLLPVKTPGN